MRVKNFKIVISTSQKKFIYFSYQGLDGKMSVSFRWVILINGDGGFGSLQPLPAITAQVGYLGLWLEVCLYVNMRTGKLNTVDGGK